MPPQATHHRARPRPDKAALADRLHPLLRPRLDRQQLLDLALAHVTNLDLVATGRAGATELWHLLAGALTWWRAAELSGIGIPEMHAQLELAGRVVERYKRTGRVGFAGPEYQAAKEGLEVMDELARTVTRATALQAAAWSEARWPAIAGEVEKARAGLQPVEHPAA